MARSGETLAICRGGREGAKPGEVGRPLLLALALPLLLVACGEAEAPAPTPFVPPISGAALDAVQANLRAIRDRDSVAPPAEHVRVERTDDGRRAVVHATLAEPLEEAGYVALCGALEQAASPVLLEGQTLEVFLLHDGAVVHSCGL